MDRISTGPKTFQMIRNGDESGVSGTGRVLDGVVWANGWVNIMWRTDLDPLKRGKASITFFESFDAFEQIHISSHPTNNTELVWDEDELIIEREQSLELTDELEKSKRLLKESRKKLRELNAEIAEKQDEDIENTEV